MTPQLQQAIKLLQLSNLELQAFVDQELEQNPFLERADEGEHAAPPTVETGDGALDGAPALAQAEPGDGWAGSSDEGWTEPLEPMPAGLGISDLARAGGGVASGGEELDGQVHLSAPRTLRDHLLEQLVVECPDPVDRLIGAHLIDEVDEAGYLRADPAQVAHRLAVDEARVLEVLARLQSFEPTGVCARSVAECLARQLRERDRFDPAMARLIDHLDLVAQADLAGLVRVCGVLPDDLPEMLHELKALDPKPGLAIGSATAETIVPDIFVYPLAPGRWRIELNGATLPKVLVNHAYFADVVGADSTGRARAFASERLQTANWLTKALDQRAHTVLRVTKAVIEHQHAFLEHGVRHLKPLLLRDIAALTELHESTISRATAGKFVATPRGTFALKYFFSNALPGVDTDGGHATEAIRQEIKGLIDGETRDRVLSDDQLVDRLKAKGIVIARRTVAKYREAMAIPSSVHRRRTKALRLA